jgi:hypothetical protein
LRDFGRTPPPLLSRAVDHIYRPGILHTYIDADGNVVAGGELQWQFGDAAIAAIDTLLLNQQRRPKEVPPEPTAEQIAALTQTKPVVTADDIIAVLTPEQQAAVAARADERHKARLQQLSELQRAR